MTVLVTGGAGYIGSHVVLALAARGEDVVVLDDLSTGMHEAVDARATFVEGNVGDAALLEQVMTEHRPAAVMHFAARTIVSESVALPLQYWRANTVFAHTLLEQSVEHGVEHFLYSSTAAVYGEPDEVPVPETAAGAPINPYGSSKYAFEQMLFDVAQSDADLRACALRYFNVAGADPELRTGQSTPNATHLVKVAVQAALGQRPHLEIFGTDWDTPDGTCVRDYIHVSDLADLHVLALERLREGAGGVFNCGYGVGYSVREVVDAALRVAGDFEVREGPRRPGDPAMLVADVARLKEAFDWEPSHDDIEHIVRTAWQWEQTLSD